MFKTNNPNSHGYLTKIILEIELNLRYTIKFNNKYKTI